SPGQTDGPNVAPTEAKPSGVTADVFGEIKAMFERGGTGASNSWSVSPALTEKGVAVLSNDPHLAHSTPGVFYMADMHLAGADGKDVAIAGCTFSGIPAVLIGHGNKIALGVTNAYADTQDIVVLQRKDA